jgi:tetratricopeptide (TPR) repeat protein
VPEQSLEECERALALDPNLAWAHANAGFMELMAGRGERTEARVRKAIRLSPRDPALGFWLTMMGAADLYLGRNDSAIQHLRTAIGANSAHPLPHFFLAAALALGGQIDEAGRARMAGLKLDPNFTVGRFRGELRSSNKVFLAQRERMYEALRLAGVPEQ